MAFLCRHCISQGAPRSNADKTWLIWPILKLTCADFFNLLNCPKKKSFYGKQLLLMASGELKLFPEALKERRFWYDFALTQLLTAGRVQEIAGLQKKSVDFKSGRLIIKDVAVWDKKIKKFDHLKNTPKKGQIREVHLVTELSKILEERIMGDKSNSNFVFHEKGVPLTYRQIQYNYNWGLEKPGLSDRFNGTHILRHSMATLTRFVTGSLDSAQAVTGHKDSRLVQHYAHLDRSENKRAIVAVENYLNQESFF